MNGPMNLAQVGPGFADVALDSQTVFRQALAALASPGSVVSVGPQEQAGVHPAAIAPAGVHPAAAALLLALLDQDTRLWLAPSVAVQAIADHLRFHPGCVRVAQPLEADFALVGSLEELPPLDAFATGSDDYPERSTTVVVQVQALDRPQPWMLRGPGIDGHRNLPIAGVNADFVARWTANQNMFPCGVDLFATCGRMLTALPRTTRIGA